MPTTGSNAATCQPCTAGNYCPGGDKKASSPTSDMGSQKSCNNPGATGLTTKQGKATKPGDCGKLAAAVSALCMLLHRSTMQGPTRHC